MSLSSRFLTAFDPANKSHVLWFKRMIQIAHDMSDPTKQVNLVAEIQMNPMKVAFENSDAMDWVHIHFVLGMKYAKAVLDHTAFIPPQ